MFYDFFIYPFVFLIEKTYLFLYAFSSNFGISLFFLSIITSITISILNKLFSKYPQRERIIQDILRPQLERIKKESFGIKRHERIQNLYKRYSYSPFYSLRALIPLFIQIPFLIGAYFMISELSIIDGKKFLFLNDLKSPDKLFMGFNILPLLMLLINFLTTVISNHITFKGKIQAYVIAIIFFFLLYNAASALLIYWLTNNLFFFLKELFYLKKMQRKNLRKSPKINFKYTINCENYKNAFQFLLNIFLSFSSFYYMLLFITYYSDSSQFNEFFIKLIFWAIIVFLWSISLIINNLKNNTVYKYIYIAITICNFLFSIFIISHIYYNWILFEEPYLFLLFSIFLQKILNIIYGLAIFKFKEFLFGKMKIKFLLILISLPFIPALHLAKANTEYLSGIYFLYFFLFVCILIVLSSIWFLLTQPFTKPRLNCLKYPIYFVTLFISLPVFRAIFKLNNNTEWDFFLILFLGFTILIFDYLKNQKKIVIYIILFLLFVNISNFFLFFLKKELKKIIEYTEPMSILEDLYLKETPNIYLLIYDGLPNERVFLDQNLPFDELKFLLEKFNFKIYHDTYSLGWHSLSSMSSMLNISNVKSYGVHHCDVYSGNSVTNLFLKKHGYKTYKLLDNYFTGTFALKNKNLVTDFFPPKTNNSVQIDFLLTLIRGIMQGELKFDTKGIAAINSELYSQKAIQEKKHEIIKKEKEKIFLVNHFNKPGHSQNSGKLLTEEKEIWISKLEESLSQIKIDIELIDKYDPEAIVIVAGDHGPFLTGDGLLLINYDKKDVTPEMMWDRLGTMVAIKWPDKQKALKYDNDLILNQDVFAVVLSYLTDTPTPLKLKPDRTFEGFNVSVNAPKITFNRGIIK